MEVSAVAFTCIALFAVFTNAVPPDACFAPFRWEDCGKEPQPVMYYWKPGSRCEVGIWRGCLPSLNMFKDEYECVSTCIFSVRAQPSAFHNQQDGEHSEGEENGDSGGSNEEVEGSSSGDADNTEMTSISGDYSTETGNAETSTLDGAVSPDDGNEISSASPEGESQTNTTTLELSPSPTAEPEPENAKPAELK